jgi:hypothetical protein
MLRSLPKLLLVSPGFEWLVSSLPVMLVNFWIIKQRIRRFLVRAKLRKQLVIGFEQGVDHGSDLPSNAANDSLLPLVGLRGFVIDTHTRKQALIEAGPRTVFFPESTAHHEIEDLLGWANSCGCKTASVK